MHIRINKKIGAIIGGILFVLLAIGAVLIIREVQREQDLRQQAEEPVVCLANQPTDTILIFDRSSSMQEPTSVEDSTPRMTRAKSASTDFVDFMSAQNVQQNHQLGLVALAGETTSLVSANLTTDLEAVKNSISSLTIESETCIECAIKEANEEFASRGRPGVKKVAIIMTDGGATRFIGSQPPYTEEKYQEAEARALAEAIKGHEEQGTVFYTIGFGDDVRVQFLDQVANETGGKYFFAPDAGELQGVFQEISTIIGKGSVTGAVFRDDNGDGIYDDSELGIGGWTVQLKNSSNTVVATATTDTQGFYFLNGLCDGEYTLSEEVKQGWEQVSPQEKTYPISIAGGSSIGEKNFGNKQAELFCPIEKALCRWDSVPSASEYQVVVTEIFPSTGQPPVQVISQTVQAPSTQLIFNAAPGRSYQCSVSAVSICGTGAAGQGIGECPVTPPPTGTPTGTPTNTPTGTLSPTATLTPTESPTPTVTGTPTNTPTGTLSPTLTPTRTPTLTSTVTPTRTPTVTTTPTSTPTRTPTLTPTRTPTLAFTSTPTRTPTLPPGSTPLPTNSPPPGAPPVVVITDAPLPTQTPVPTVFVATNTPGPTVVPTGDATTVSIIGVAASVLVILGAILFFAL